MIKFIAILLTVYNRKEQTLICLKNIYEQYIPGNYKIQVYLTDDGCTDGTPESIRIKFPQVHVIKGNGNLFWNRGMWTAWNAAIKDQQYDYFLWLNDDTNTYPQMLSSLIEASESKENKAIIVGATVDTSRQNIQTYGGRKNKELVPLNGKLQKCDTFNGNIVLIPNYVYKQLGCNDPYFQHSFGDLDYGMKASKAHIAIYQYGKAVGECDRHEHIMQWADPKIYLANRWKNLFQPTGFPPKEVFYFNKKHYGITVAILRVITTLTRCLFPNLWIKLNKAGHNYEVLNHHTPS